MINTNGGSCAGAAPAADEKLIQAAPKKLTLKDVQNENVGSIPKLQENFVARGRQSTDDSAKVSATKRSERHLSSQSLAYNGTNENIMNANRRFDLELGRGRLQNSIEKFSESRNMGQLRHLIPPTTTHLKEFGLRQVPVTAPNSTTTTVVFPSSGASIAGTLGKHQNSNSAAKISLEAAREDTKNTRERLTTERFIQLQAFLKQYNDSNLKECTQTLLRMTSSELSKHAVDLEKRAIQLTFDEGTEIERMKALGILAKSSPSTVLLQSPQSLHSDK